MSKHYTSTLVIVFAVVFLAILLKPIMFYESLAMERANFNTGVLDVSTLDFSKGLYQLNGAVETYQNQLISVTGRPDQKPIYHNLPFAWQARDGVTSGSYRFVLKGLEPEKLYGFYLYDALTAYEVFVDGQSIGHMGVPAENGYSTIGASKVQALSFEVEHSEAVVVIHTSSKSSHLIGIWQKTLFGPLPLIQQYEVRAKASDAFLIGALFFMAAYVWILFIIMRQDKAVLYFAITCSLVTIKSLFSGQQLGFVSYPIVNYDIGLRLAYLMVPGILVSIMAFTSEIFRKIIWRPYERIAYSLSALQAGVIVFMSQRMYQESFIFYQVFIVISVAMVFYWSVKAYREKLEGAILYFIGYTVFFAFALNDILYSLLWIHTGYYLGVGLFVLILSQAAILALRVQRALQTEAYLKSFLEQEVEDRTKELELQRDKFEKLSKVDSLTHLYNKGYMSELLQYEFEGYKRYRGSLSVLMIDLDHFKSVNDNYGHVTGDMVLKRVADCLLENSRRSDIVGRFGGEEFIVVLRFTALSDAHRHAEMLRRHIEALSFDSDGKRFSITTSIGVASVYDGLLDEKQLIHEADEALYEAKRRGRNCVISHGRLEDQA